MVQSGLKGRKYSTRCFKKVGKKTIRGGIGEGIEFLPFDEVGESHGSWYKQILTFEFDYVHSVVQDSFLHRGWFEHLRDGVFLTLHIIFYYLL